MKTENWLNCHAHAFNYFGGVSKAAHLVQWDKNNFSERFVQAVS